MPILEGQGVSKLFGGLAAVSNVDFHVDQGEIIGLIGPNGAGKTTLFNLVSGALPLSSGEIRFKGQTLDGPGLRKERTWKPTAAGILSIIGGVGLVTVGIVFAVFLGMAAEFMGGIVIRLFGAQLILMEVVLIGCGVIAIAGGVCSLMRRVWGLAIAGAICALPAGFIFGILAIIFLILGKREFGYGMVPHQICRAGIARTFQETKVFANMPVLHNVLVGAFFGTPGRSKVQTLNGLDLKKKTWKPTAAGILSIIGGVGQMIGGIIFAIGARFLTQFTGMEFIGGFAEFFTTIAALLIVLGGVAIVGGVYALRRRFWELALAGSICALPLFVFGIPAIIFVNLGKGEFRPSTSLEAANREATQELEFVGLSEMSAVPVKDLTLVDQKRVEVARALATKPELLLLDELMAGLNPAEVSEAMELVRKIRDRGITIFMVEHVMKAIMGLCERIMVLHHGEKIAEGTPQEIAANNKVIEIYLGEAAHAGS